MGRVFRAALALVVGAVSICNAPVAVAQRKVPAVYACTGTPAQRPVLALGSHHPCVGYLERFLTTTYDAESRLRPDSSFGWPTFKLVVQLQLDFAVHVDEKGRGRVGEATWAVIDDVVAAQSSAAPFAERYSRVQFYGASHMAISRHVLRRLLDSAGIHGIMMSAVKGSATTFGANNALTRLRTRVKANLIPDLIVMQTGNNDANMLKRADRSFGKLEDPAQIKAAARAIFDDFIGEFMTYVDALPGPPDVVWMTTARRDPQYVRDEWFNESLFEEQARRAALADPSRATLTVIDFASKLVTHPAWFGYDGIHLTDEGYRQRSRCIVGALLAYESFGDQTVIRCP